MIPFGRTCDDSWTVVEGTSSSHLKAGADDRQMNQRPETSGNVGAVMCQMMREALRSVEFAPGGMKIRVQGRSYRQPLGQAACQILAAWTQNILAL